MRIKNLVGLTVALLILSATIAIAQPKPSNSPQLVPNPVVSTQQQKELEKLQQEKEIRDRVQEEVDRAFSRTTTILNILLVVLTLLPILAAAGVWLLRRSVISELVAETKQQLTTEVETQLKKEVAAELQKQTAAFKQELETLKLDFIEQLSELKNLFLDAQNQKEKILQELSELTPSPALIQDYIHPEIQQKIQDLTTQLENLKAGNPQLFFSNNDYLKQGDAFYAESRYTEALPFYDLVVQKEPDSYAAWINRGWTLRKLHKYEEAIISFEKGIFLKSDEYIAWHGLGNALRNLGRYDEAISAYNKALEIRPDYAWSWHHIARCYSLLGNYDLALDNLQKAVNLKPEKHKQLAKNNPEFDALKDDKRFKKLIEQ
ncbi:tetratricopeptide repeat protein [Anabaena catenula]|uniref:Tetratricopeptide repeat protein n=1 Tax=Anabaena catenula FACHB-362 TaxID=2692877 RepID=A0ABR8J3R7_9NOST|nr:tetratricopeptide repeat protein [Anabaena catenula]MBD2693017.1 tetratricopeptide repeat protein [Anabaena catenula FACHB-362]